MAGVSVVAVVVELEVIVRSLWWVVSVQPLLMMLVVVSVVLSFVLHLN
tara:strand:- start:991 stop:1134 length:144 start_codon:yes stop_codon:yes gene_type:complete